MTTLQPDSLDGDPARQLWERVEQDELAIILPFFSQRPVPVGRIATALGLKVQADALDVNLSGSIKKVSDAPARFEITVNVADSPVRQRFTVAHEIGHFLLHRSLIDQEGIIDTILFRSRLSNSNEVQANKIAAALLLPWKNVVGWCQNEYKSPPTQAIISDIARAYRVSELTVGFRFSF